ncbi:MAG TPA: hypothetical protein VM328_00115 [Fimbriimonadaceae bacterium]|nr:hypothetical protein [Fimbriimonadaceae bacterium]
MLLESWTVSYHADEKPHPVKLPHAWRQDVPVFWEGPAIYETELQVPKAPAWLVFHGVSYEARVFIEGRQVGHHRGIWDAFSVSLRPFAGKKIRLRVEVVKNGGQTYPVKEVASGFLPYVFHTFGGIYQPVEVAESPEDPLANPPPAPETRVFVDGHRLYVDGEPFYIRGALTWGWYPEIGHTNPPEETIRKEVRLARSLGFNLVKFCLWVPPHRYLEILAEEGMEAWMELPLWDPTDDPERQAIIASEIERVVRQYRRHSNIICWTVGCELSGATRPEYRRHLTQMVRNLTGCPLVKDNSGGAEMYGGDLREFGDFYDFHPYCDTHFYPSVLDSLLPTSRKRMPILLGEFNDVDVHRDIAALHDERPFWASSLPELNDVGVRWQHDLPRFLATSRFALEPGENEHDALMESSRQKALWMRKTVHEWVRAREAISGYVVTGWRDTPISTAGFVDDWGRARFSASEVCSWNGPSVLYLIPTRRPTWVHGGNRPGFLDSFHHFTGAIYLRVGAHSDHDLAGGLVWRILSADGETVAGGAEERVLVPTLSSEEVGQIHWECHAPGVFTLEVEFADACNAWELAVVESPDWQRVSGWGIASAGGALDDLKLSGGPNLISFGPSPVPAEGAGIVFLTDVGTVARPFWRESAYVFSEPDFWSRMGLRGGWGRWLPIAPDRAIEPKWLVEQGLDEGQVLMTRVDVRTYEELPMLVRKGNAIVTTLRPWGGLGMQPTSLSRNPIGSHLLWSLVQLLSEDS